MRPDCGTVAQRAQRAAAETLLLDALEACSALSLEHFEEAMANAITKRARTQDEAHAVAQRIERNLYMRARHG